MNDASNGTECLRPAGTPGSPLDAEGPHETVLPDGLSTATVGLSYYDGDQTNFAVREVSLTIPSTGFYGIMGPSGSGKSSILYLLSGLKRATSGDIQFGSVAYSSLTDKELTRLRRERFGFVFQQPFLLNYLTSVENVVTAAIAATPSAYARAHSLLAQLGVDHFADRFPYTLSGGERQRVCVARAMMNQPAVIFADEPTASLDQHNGHAVVELLASYRNQGTVLIVTHDAAMLQDADRTIHMLDGRVVD